MKYVGVGIVTLLISLKRYLHLSIADLINTSFGSTSVIVRLFDSHIIHIRNCAGQGMPKFWLKNRFVLLRFEFADCMIWIFVTSEIFKLVSDY